MRHRPFRSFASRLAVAAMLLFVALGSGGCFLRLLFGAVGVRDTGTGAPRFIASLRGEFQGLAWCLFDEEDGTIATCHYTFADPELGVPETETSTVDLRRDFGVLGLFVAR